MASKEIDPYHNRVHRVARFIHRWFNLYGRKRGWIKDKSEPVPFDDDPVEYQLALLDTAQNLIDVWPSLVGDEPIKNTDYFQFNGNKKENESSATQLDGICPDCNVQYEQTSLNDPYNYCPKCGRRDDKSMFRFKNQGSD